MKTLTPAEIERAKRLLAYEGGGHGCEAEACATAAGRLYDTVTLQLAPLVGSSGVKALFVRSAKLANRSAKRKVDIVLDVEDSTKLRESLLGHEPEIAREVAEALFATFFTLLTTFIGERLTSELLRAWPSADEISKETEK